MKGLSSIERVVLESINKDGETYETILAQSGLHENVCFNVIQALLIRGLIISEGSRYFISKNISPLMMEEINGNEARHAESLELIEAVLEQKYGRVFRFQKVALDPRDEKIFLAMLSNLDSFLQDAHKKAQGTIPVKERKVVFWGMGEVQNLLSQMITGR